MSPFDGTLLKFIQLELCNMEFYNEGCVRTIFRDGKTFEGWPHDSAHYREIAFRCGYIGVIIPPKAIETYCQEHDFCHNFIAERLNRNVSQVLWPMAHKAPVDRYLGLGEEAIVQIFQRWLRADERPILDGPDWDTLKADALGLLDG